MCVDGKIKDGEAGSLMGLRVDPQQNLVRELMPDSLSRLPKGNVQDIAFKIVRDMNRSHLTLLDPLLWGVF